VHLVKRVFVHQQVGQFGGAAFAARAMKSLESVMNSRTMAAAGLLDPTTVLDKGLRVGTGLGLYETLFTTPAHRAMVRVCRTGECI
jgi:hypothetical protein